MCSYLQFIDNLTITNILIFCIFCGQNKKFKQDINLFINKKSKTSSKNFERRFLK
jgi:hypothetical protein